MVSDIGSWLAHETNSVYALDSRFTRHWREIVDAPDLDSKVYQTFRRLAALSRQHEGSVCTILKKSLNDGEAELRSSACNSDYG